jgi:hypothetical protein
MRSRHLSKTEYSKLHNNSRESNKELARVEIEKEEE